MAGGDGEHDGAVATGGADVGRERFGGRHGRHAGEGDAFHGDGIGDGEGAGDVADGQGIALGDEDAAGSGAGGEGGDGGF